MQMMSNMKDIITQFKLEHQLVMLDLSINGVELGVYNAVDLWKNLFLFANEVGATVRIDGKARRGVSIYEEYWHCACALIPESVARTDLIHALLFIFIQSQGHDVILTRTWAQRRNTIFNRLVDERTLISDLVNKLRCESWLDVEAIEELIARSDVFNKN